MATTEMHGQQRRVTAARTTLAPRPAAVLLLLMLLLDAASTHACTLTMAYQPRSKAPFISASPDNDGIYLQLYQHAAERVGCALTVKRIPKKRIAKLMQSGQVDFYPGFKFSAKRAEYATFLPNGLVTGRIGVSRADMPDTTALAQLAGRRVLISLGGVDYARDVPGVRVLRVANLDVARAVAMIRAGRADFYATDPTDVLHHLRSANITGIKLHQRCCGGQAPMYLGFSRDSPFYAEAQNPGYRTGEAAGADNLPYRVAEDSVAYEFAESLRQMHADGTTAKIVAPFVSDAEALLLPASMLPSPHN